MGKFRVNKNSFLGGQVSKDAIGRTDLPQYAHSCEILQNMIPLLSGGAYRRPGTMFQDYIPANFSTPGSDTFLNNWQSSPPRLFPFIVSENLAYALVIGTQRCSFLQDPANNPSGISGGSYLAGYRATGNNNDAVAVSNLGNSGRLPYRCKSSLVAASATNQCTYTRQGGPSAVANTGVNMALVPVTILDVADSLKSYEDDVWAVQFCQANDVMFLTHPDYPPQVISLTSPDTFFTGSYDYNLTGLELAQSRPYLNQNSTAVTLKYTFSGGGATGTLTASTAFFNPLHGPRAACGAENASANSDGAIFALAVGEGSAMSGNNTNNGILFLQVVSVTDSTHCAVAAINGVPSNYGSATTTTVWWESAWSNYRGWPRSCAIFEQRLCFAGTIHQPNALWFTAVSVYGSPTTLLAQGTACKFTALGDGPNQGFVAGATGVLANGRNYTTPANWVYYPVDDSQGDGQSTGPLGSQPFRISLATTSLDAIQYLSPDQQLFIGTSTQEWICASANGSFDVANSVCTIQSHYGSDFVQAVRIGYELIFVLQKKDEIRAYQYNYYDQSFFGEPVQLFFDEYPIQEDGQGPTQAGPIPGIINPLEGRRKYRQVDWDATRSTVWCVDTAGNLFGMTRDRKLAVTSWHTHQFGGFDAATGVGQDLADNLTAGNHYTDSANFLCNGSVLSICSTPNPMSGMRDLWLIIKRSLGGKDTWSLERMVGGNTVRQSAYSLCAPGNAQEPLYVDCAYFLADNGDPTDFTYTVGPQLVGKTLVGTYYSQAWGLFAIDTQAPVASDGTINLQTDLPADYGDPAAFHVMVVGLSYSSILKPVRIDPPSPIGTSQGAIKRPSKAYVRLFKTLMLKMGKPPEGGAAAVLETIPFKPASVMGKSPEIFTGDKQVFLPTTYDRDGYVYIVQDQPLPFTIVSLSIEGVEYEQ